MNNGSLINLIIWSKNRACQLDALLRSINEYAPNTFYPVVVAKAIGSDHQKAYDQLFSERSVPFTNEEDFYKDTLQEITSDFEFTAFSTDDMIFYRELPSKPWLPELPNQIFSFRLGRNTTIQNCHTGEKQLPLFNPLVKDSCLEWCPKDYIPLSNYAYPLALDLHVFRTEYLQQLLKNIGPFRNSNELESKMQAYTYDIDVMRSYTESVAFNIPCNNLSSVTRAGEQFPYSNEFLNEQYLSGKRIDIDKVSTVPIVGAHQEICLELV
jgi:hypothetical protein